VQTGRDEAKEIRAFGLSDALRERFDGIYRRYLADLRRHVGRRSRLALIGNLGAAVFLGLALVAVILLIDRGRIGLAGAAIVAIRLLSSQVSTVFKSAQQIFESGLFLDDLDDFVAMRPAAEQAEDGAPGPSRFDEITVEGLDFTYPDSDTLALRDVTLRIRSGEIIALVGENGSGKTTLAKLLATLYDPDAGRIAWDGVDVSNYRRADLRRSIAVIFQDFVHYHMTARDNIGLGRVDRLDDTGAIVEALGLVFRKPHPLMQRLERRPVGVPLRH
jgi:ATP-binding cassette subfamily B protein